MDRFLRLIVAIVIGFTIASCTSSQNTSDDELSIDESSDQTATENSESASGAEDEFAEFEDEEKKSEETAQNEKSKEETSEQAQNEPQQNQEEEKKEQVDQAPQESLAESTPVDTPAPVESTPTPAPTESISQPTQGMANILGLKYKGNESGGTVIIEADAPLTYTTRMNSELQQFIIEVPQSILPKRLQRPLNTKDIQGSIGAIDAYQNSGSTTSRFVIQLREGAESPAVQVEGNSLLIVGSGQLERSAETQTLTEQSQEQNENLSSAKSGILTSSSLADYLAGNTRFYGKKISIETSNMDVRDALRFVTEESGANLVVAEEVKGNISLKLRQVPWDQALVMIMKAKSLGYSRQGNVLRIATLEQLRKEEEDATKLLQNKRTIEPLKVRMFSISYAQVADLERRVQAFLSERGKVVADVRTNSLVVTDIGEYVERAEKLVRSLDVQPAQVLIEAKIVEATEDFLRRVGINWGITGADISLGGNGSVTLRPQLSTNSITTSAADALSFNTRIGTLNILGDLSSSLALHERDSRVKVISSPRLSTLTNEKANISQTTEVPIRQVTATGSGSQTTYTFKPLTLKLEVTPQVTADASIIMQVNLKREFQGAIISDAGSDIFSVNAREANTKILVKNGQTAVMGGIYTSDAQDGETGVPYLRELPVIGALFRGKTTSRQKSELLLFLTPRISTPLGGQSSSTTNMNM